MATSEGAREPWRNALFDSLLRGIRIQSTVFFRPEFRAPWGVNIARDCGVFHIVHQGSCWLQVKGVDEPLRDRDLDLRDRYMPGAPPVSAQ